MDGVLLEEDCGIVTGALMAAGLSEFWEYGEKFVWFDGWVYAGRLCEQRLDGC